MSPPCAWDRRNHLWSCWPIIDRSLDYMIGSGADYFVSVKFDDLANSLIAKSVTPEQKKLLILKNKHVKLPKNY